jgi:hypothetical protein
MKSQNKAMCPSNQNNLKGKEWNQTSLSQKESSLRKFPAYDKPYAFRFELLARSDKFAKSIYSPSECKAKKLYQSIQPTKEHNLTYPHSLNITK